MALIPGAHDRVSTEAHTSLACVGLGALTSIVAGGAIRLGECAGTGFGIAGCAPGASHSRAFLGFAIRRTPIAIDCVAVIARLTGLDHAITAEFASASGRTAIVRCLVVVIAFLATFHHPVATDPCAASRSAAITGLRISVVALFSRLNLDRVLVWHTRFGEVRYARISTVHRCSTGKKMRSRNFPSPAKITA